MKLRNQASVLILAEIFLIITSAFWSDLEGGHWLTLIYFTFFTFGGYCLAQDKAWLYKYIVLCLATLLLGMVPDSYWGAVAECVCSTLAHLMIFKELVKHSFFRKKVRKSDRILSGIAGYLLLGLFWSGIFTFIVERQPGAILNQVSGEGATVSESLYFGFVTITSLGYGDIVPVTAGAKIVAIFAGTSGVLFTAIFISALVGNLMAKENDEPAG